MINLVLAVTVTCSLPTIVDHTKHTWGTAKDLEALLQAKMRCEPVFGSDAPCLKKLEKMEEGVYRATCGKS